jgi:hypothetical protein
MSDLNRGCAFCGRKRISVDGRMITIKATTPQKPEHPEVSICAACCNKPISALLIHLKVLL